MNKDLVAIFDYLEREKGINRDILVSLIQESVQVAVQKTLTSCTEVDVSINSKTGEIAASIPKEVVTKVVLVNDEISLEDARKIDPHCELNQTIPVPISPKKLTRIAAQKAKQMITQKLRHVERDIIYEEYRHRMNELVSGTVKRFLGSSVVIDLGKVEAILPTRQYPRGESYRLGERVLALLLKVEDNINGGADVILSRNDPEFVKQLFIQEVPEISDKNVEIVDIVRDPGYRTKVLVKAIDSKFDPVGACIGMKGNRVKNIIRELNNEKIDIIPYTNDKLELLQNILAPIEIQKYAVSDDYISIVVSDDNLAAAVGKKGGNSRLNAKLIGKPLDIKKISEYNRSITLQRLKLASSEDESLDLPLKSIGGISSLVIEDLIDNGLDTVRKLLQSSSNDISEKVPSVSKELADDILEIIRKERM